jgi:transposase
MYVHLWFSDTQPTTDPYRIRLGAAARCATLRAQIAVDHFHLVALANPAVTRGVWQRGARDHRAAAKAVARPGDAAGLAFVPDHTEAPP